MNEILVLLVGATLVNYFVLTQLGRLAMLPGLSGKPEIVIGITTGLALTLSSACAYLLYHYLLVPRDLVLLRTPAYMLLIVTAVVLVCAVMQQYAPQQYHLATVFQPLVFINCAVLSATLINDNRADTLADAVFSGLVIAAGFSLMLLLFSAMQERVTVADVPKPFRGAAIALITAGLMSLALMGVASLVPS
jgi:electron transport complex protein RnfA